MCSTWRWQGRLAAVFNKCAGTSGGSGAAGSSGAAEADLDSFLIEAGAACGLDKQPEDGAKVRRPVVCTHAVCCSSCDCEQQHICVQEAADVCCLDDACFSARVQDAPY